MAKRDRVILESFRDFLQSNLDGFSSYPIKTQFHFCDLAFRLDQKRFQHKKYGGYSSLPYQEIYSKFGRNFLSMNDDLDFFEITSDWSKVEKRTRGVRLSPKLAALKNKFLKRDPILSELIDDTGKILRTLPDNGLADVSITNQKNTKIKSVIPVNKRALARLVKNLVSAKKDIGLAVDDILRVARTIKHHSWSRLAGKNRLIMRYHESNSGRLYASGTNNLQNAHKLVKDAALSGCWEYDFENCHFVIFMHLAARIGIQCPAIQHYIANKKAVRYAIAEDIGISPNDAKTCLIALMYGAQATTWHEAAIPQLIGNNSGLLYEHPLFYQIKEEVTQTRAKIIQQWPDTTQRSIINAMGKKIKKTEKPKFIMSHIQQGIEAKMLHIAIEKAGEDQIVLLQHDGFSTGDKIETQPIINQIGIETGIKVQIKNRQHRVGWKEEERKKEGYEGLLTYTEIEKNICRPHQVMVTEI